MVGTFNVHKGHSLFFPCGQARKRLLHIQLFQAAGLLPEQRAEADGFLQILAAGAQALQLAVHTLCQRALSFQHLPDLGQRHVQLAQQFDAAQAFHVRLGVAAVAVARLPARGDEPLLLVKADVLFGHADGGFHFVDLHGPAASLQAHLTPSRKGKVKRFLQNDCKNSPSLLRRQPPQRWGLFGCETEGALFYLRNSI